MSRPTLLVGGVLVLTTLLSSCSQGAPASPRTAGDRPRFESYVALGDSFTAAPFVPVTDFARGCLRSSSNYPTRVADALGAELRDVSCSGATTADIVGRQSVAGGRGTVAPQLAAVEPDTDLVTVGVGGNDKNLFALLAHACTRPAERRVGPCAPRLHGAFGSPDLLAEEIGRRVAAVLRRVHRAAPAATVVLVGYPRLVDTRGACAAMPLAADALPVLARFEGRLNVALRRAAASTGARFVDMHAASRGHEICSASPWVNGKSTDESRALAYHPFPEGQKAVARALLATVRG